MIDAKAKPLTADDDRTAAQRQAEALADVCGYVLNHDDQLPETGGRRPQVTVIVRLEDLERRARAAMLEFGGTLSPASLRMLACDANVIPVVMGGAGQRAAAVAGGGRHWTGTSPATATAPNSSPSGAAEPHREPAPGLS